MPSEGPAEEADLARAAESGDRDAQFAYALKLLDGERAAMEGPRAIALIDEAAGKGQADAVAMSALFQAMGAMRPQSWTGAIDTLKRAADLGSDSAQGQLAVLSFRGGVTPEDLLRPPSGQRLSDSPRIISYSAFATPEECDWIIARARDRLGPAKVFSKATGDQTYNAVRDNSAIEFQLSHMDVVLEVMRARISAATRLPVPIFEPTQILRYEVGQQFRPHRDYLDPDVPGFAEHLRQFGQRIATVLVYLNEGYSGGETVFPNLGISYRGRKGDALFFTNVDRTGRGDPSTTHAGTPPTEGEKWVLSQWIRDREPGYPAGAGAAPA